MSRFNRIYTDREYRDRLARLSELEKERVFCLHDPEHFLAVARIMYIISLEKKMDIPRDIIYAAALLHDMGRVEQYEKGIPHNIAGADFAMALLPECGYNNEETEMICSAIRFHRGSSDNVRTGLAELLYRADKLSRRCYDCASEAECYWEKNRKNSEISY